MRAQCHFYHSSVLVSHLHAVLIVDVVAVVVVDMIVVESAITSVERSSFYL